MHTILFPALYTKVTSDSEQSIFSVVTPCHGDDVFVGTKRKPVTNVRDSRGERTLLVQSTNCLTTKCKVMLIMMKSEHVRGIKEYF